MKFAAWYGILVGSLMIVQWGVSILSGGVPEFQSEPWRIAFHLVAEFSTAIMLIVSGIAVLKAIGWSKQVLMLGLGMVIYSEIVSPGYVAQLGQWTFVIVFAVLLIGAAIAVVQMLNAEQKKSFGG